MIVRIRKDSAPGQEAYLALERSEDGEWTPLSAKPDGSADAAMRRCVAGVQGQLVRLEEHTERQTEMMRYNLQRLWDTAAIADVVRIGVEICPVDDSGTVTMPGPLSPPSSTPGQRRKALVALVGDEVVETLRTALELPSERDQAAGLIVDLVLDMPLDVLLSVSDCRPGELGEVAAFMAVLYRACSAQGETAG